MIFSGQPRQNRQCGFTLVELVVIIIILGVLAAVAVPRLDTHEYRALQFHDQTVSALRYAQKTATSHRRLVCVAFTNATVTLTIAQANPGACNTPLNLPGTNTNVVQSSDAVNAVFTNPIPASLNFNPNGTGIDTVLTMTDLAAITVAGATGHVQ